MVLQVLNTSASAALAALQTGRFMYHATLQALTAPAFILQGTHPTWENPTTDVVYTIQSTHSVATVAGTSPSRVHTSTYITQGTSPVD